MIDKISTCLFNPRFIGKFINDCFIKIFGYIFFFFCLTLIPISLRLAADNDLSSADRRLIINGISGEADSLIYFDGDNFGGTGSLNFEVDDLYVSFLDDTYNNSTNSISFTFLSDKVKLYSGGVHLISLSYTSLNVEAFEIAAVQNGNLLSQDKFLGLIDEVYASFSLVTLPYSIFVFILNLLISFVLVFFVSFILTATVNPGVNSKFRVKIVLYSTLSFWVFQFFAYLVDLEFLSYIGFAFPFIYSSLALRSIMRIEVKKKS